MLYVICFARGVVNKWWLVKCFMSFILQGGSHRQEKSSCVCLPWCVCSGSLNMWRKKQKGSLRFFFLPNSWITQLHYQLEMRLVRLSAFGWSTTAGQNPEIPLGNVVTLGTVRCNESRVMAQGGCSNAIVIRGWCGLGFCRGCSFQVFFFFFPIVSRPSKIRPQPWRWPDSRLLSPALLFSESSEWVLAFFFCLKWL